MFLTYYCSIRRMASCESIELKDLRQLSLTGLAIEGFAAASSCRYSDRRVSSNSTDCYSNLWVAANRYGINPFREVQ